MAEVSGIKAERAATIGRALGHPLRVEIIESFSGEAIERSPSELAARLEQPLHNVSYHVDQLVKAGALRLTRTEPVRGALEHFYSLTRLGLALQALLDSI
jgi:DNA-binding transcriptional ArsR family regulator